MQLEWHTCLLNKKPSGLMGSIPVGTAFWTSSQVVEGMGLQIPRRTPIVGSNPISSFFLPVGRMSLITTLKLFNSASSDGEYMKYRIEATYKNQTFQFNLYDNVKWLKILYKTAGITLTANHVFVKYDLQEIPTIVGHEAIHVHQARNLGWKYLPTYVWEWIRAGCSYSQNTMEIEAYDNEHTVTWKIIRKGD